MSKTSEPIARLRVLGVIVTTLIGHAPERGTFNYGLHHAPNVLEDGETLTMGTAKARIVPVLSNGARAIVVQAMATPTNSSGDLYTPEHIAQREADVALLLSALADRIEKVVA